MGRRKKTGCRRRIVNKEDLAAEEGRREREGELLPRAPLFHVRLSSVLGTASSLTDPLTDTSTPTRWHPDNSSSCKPTHRTGRPEDAPPTFRWFSSGRSGFHQTFLLENNSKQKISLFDLFLHFQKKTSPPPKKKKKKKKKK